MLLCCKCEPGLILLENTVTRTVKAILSPMLFEESWEDLDKILDD